MSNGEVKELWGRSFHLVRRGLDEAEVLTFVNELLRSDSTLVQRQKQMLSLQELSQQMTTMVTEARTLSESIVQQAKMEAEALRNKTLAEARNMATELKSRAEAEARASQEKAQQALQEARASQEKAQQALQEAAARAAFIQKEAVSDALQAVARARQVIEEKLVAALEQMHLALSTQFQDLTQGLKALEARWSETPVEASSTSTPRQASPEPPAESPHPPAPAMEATPQTVLTETLPQTVLTEAAPQEEEPAALYQGEVVLVVSQPVGETWLRSLEKRLAAYPEVRVLSTIGALGEATRIAILLERPMPLAEVLRNIPDIEGIVEDEGRTLDSKNFFFKWRKVKPVTSTPQEKVIHIIPKGEGQPVPS